MTENLLYYGEGNLRGITAIARRIPRYARRFGRCLGENDMLA